jgi:hypothetical protein
MEWCCAHQTNEAAYCFYNYVMCPLYTVSIAIPMKLDAPKVIFFCITCFLIYRLFSYHGV